MARTKTSTVAKAATARERAKAAKKSAKARSAAAARRDINCYLCGHALDVSERTMSTTCPGCNKAIKVEDVTVKSYIPVIDLQTCGVITVAKRGRVAAQRVQAGEGIINEGAIEGAIDTRGPVALGPKSSWKGKHLKTHSLVIEEGAELNGHVTVIPEEGIKASRDQGIKGRERPDALENAGTASKPTAKAASVVEPKPRSTATTRSSTKTVTTPAPPKGGDAVIDASIETPATATTTKKKTTRKTTAKKAATTRKKVTKKKTTTKKTAASKKTTAKKKKTAAKKKTTVTRKTAKKKTTTKKKTTRKKKT